MHEAAFEPTVDTHVECRLPARQAIESLLPPVARGFGPLVDEPRKTSVRLVASTAFAGLRTTRDAPVLTIEADRDGDRPRISEREQTSARRRHHDARLVALASRGKVSAFRSRRVVRALSIVALAGWTLAALPSADGATRLRPRRPPDSSRHAIADLQRPIVSARPLDGATLPTPTRSPLEPGDAIPPLAKSGVTLPPVGELPSAWVAERERIDAIASWNREHPELLRAGFARNLLEPRAVTIDASSVATATSGADLSGGRLTASPWGSIVWTARVRVDGAHRIRLHLGGVELPKGARIWVAGDDRIAHGPVGRELVAADRGLWCPSVAGENVWIAVHVPAEPIASGARCAFVVDRVAEIFRIDDAGGPIAPGFPASESAVERGGGGRCLKDVSCGPDTPEILHASRAVGRMLFMKDGFLALCSGGLLNNLVADGTPYFLTAHHCVSSQAEASSLEVLFDYRSATCDGAEPADPPTSLGATLIATRELSDFTLLQLASVPPNRWYMGWTTAPPDGATLERVSHPGGGLQAYSTTRALTENRTCSVQGTPFVPQEKLEGGIAPGSSGAPLWMGDTIVVGQLWATCGGDPNDSCAREQSILDGRFAATFPYVRESLEGDDGTLAGAPTSLVASAVDGARVDLAWTDNTAGDVVFNVERRPSGGTFAVVATTDANATTFVDTTVTEGRSYEYRVRARSTEGGPFTGYSNAASATTPSDGPAAPEGVAAAKIKKKKVTLTWLDMSDDEDAFEVLVLDGSSYQPVLTVAAGATAAAVKGLGSRRTYRFGVRSCNARGCSAIGRVTVTTK